MENTFQIGMVLFPKLTQLDLTGPFEVLSRVPGTKIHLLWKEVTPIRADSGLTIMPTLDFTSCPKLDMLFIPGGPGQKDLMEDQEVLQFLRTQGAQCEFVTSVCTGALVLGAAGLLEGYQATTHWAARPLLANFGAEPTEKRVVWDRNRITGGGVTAGIDFAFQIVAHKWGEELAKMLQLGLEYDPAPPFDAGTPEKAGPALVETILPFLSTTA